MILPFPHSRLHFSTASETGIIRKLVCAGNNILITGCEGETIYFVSTLDMHKPIRETIVMWCE